MSKKGLKHVCSIQIKRRHKKRLGNAFGYLCSMKPHLQKKNRTIEESSERNLTTKLYISKWLHRFTTNVCVTVFHAGHSYTTVFNAYTIACEQNFDLTFRSYGLGHNSYLLALVW